MELAAQIGAAVMPIQAYLDGDDHRFDDETIRRMGIAFEMAVGSLGATPCYNDSLRQALAGNIIALAKTGERDPERLCQGALKAVRPPHPLPGSRPPTEAEG